MNRFAILQQVEQKYGLEGVIHFTETNLRPEWAQISCEFKPEPGFGSRSKYCKESITDPCERKVIDLGHPGTYIFQAYPFYKWPKRYQGWYKPQKSAIAFRFVWDWEVVPATESKEYKKNCAKRVKYSRETVKFFL